jgi:hypothetical protein
LTISIIDYESVKETERERGGGLVGAKTSKRERERKGGQK